MRTFLLFTIALGLALPLAAEPWVGIDLPTAAEPAVAAALEARGVTVLTWSTAVVDVSDFQGLTDKPLADLSTALTTADPRWDPWLKSLEARFHPRAGTSRLWVEASHRDLALQTAGAQGRAAPQDGGPLLPRPEKASPAGPLSPRAVTGWVLLLFSLLYLALWGLQAWWSTEPLGARARWWLAPGLALALALGGAGLAVSTLRWTPTAPVAKAEAGLWLRHRWFQEAWPYGAQWSDWTPGKAWGYPVYTRQDGRIVEGRVELAVPDDAWAAAARKALGPHAAARLFSPENP